MLSFRDQENLVHAHQQAAVAKPLNQGVRGLAPKTPGNNGKIGLNGRMTGRNGGRDDENTFVGGLKTGKAQKATFITPMGMLLNAESTKQENLTNCKAQRERAPLGAKTTNVKANAFRTPAPKTGDYGLQKTQKRTTSARKHKLKVHQPELLTVEPVINLEEEDEPEIEYCPPKIIPMLDIPDQDQELFRFEDDDFFSGGLQGYRHDPIGDDGLRKSERDARREQKEFDDETDRVLNEAVKQTCTLTDDDLRLFGIEPIKTAATSRDPAKKERKIVNPTTSTRIASSLQSKAAAAALSTKSRPHFAAPTAAAKARNAATSTSNPLTSGRKAASPGTAASRTTIGYAAGRRVSSSLKQRPNAVPLAPRNPNGPVTTLSDLLNDFSLDPEFDDDDYEIPWQTDVNSIVLEGIDDLKDFRLEMPGEN